MRKKRNDKNRKGTLRKIIFKIVKNTLFTIALSCLLLTSTYLITMRVKGEQPELFGYKFYVVLTGSMEPEINPGDMVIVKNVNYNSINVGDIITFTDVHGKNITTHRVTNIEFDGETKFITKGDANNTEDEGKVSESQILGKLSKNVKGAGSVLSYIKENILVLAFLLIFIIIMIISVSAILKRIDKDCKHVKKVVKGKQQ